MLGRAAYHNPSLLRDVDRLVYDTDDDAIEYGEIIDRMCGYADRHLARGGKLHQITRHMIGLFQGMPGARGWRQVLSTKAVRAGARPEVLREAYQMVTFRSVAAE